ncbi:MAG: prepilin peptidase, partial [Rhodospirillales bacterium]|nr:prepilin peptidase [Rhodospirillales bacterium]
GLLVLAAINDVAEYRIPNRINLAIAALYPAHVLASPVSVDWMGGLIVASCALALGVALFALRHMGGGDIKMIAATALWAGPLGITEFLFVTALAGGLLAIAKLAPVRAGLAMTIGRLTGVEIRESHYVAQIPYGVAIAFGGFSVGALILGAGRIL